MMVRLISHNLVDQYLFSFENRVYSDTPIDVMDQKVIFVGSCNFLPFS